MPDTSRDLRIMAVERLIAMLLERIKRRKYGSVKQTIAAVQLLEEAASKIAVLRYSYMSDEDLAGYDETRALVDGVSRAVAKLGDVRSTSPDAAAFLHFVDAVVSHLPEAFGLGPSLESLTPIEVGRVQNVDRAPKAKSLRLCSVAAFGQTLQIVTNLVKTRAGNLMKVARVPPTEIMGMLSVAQFVGTAPSTAVEGERPQLNDSEAQEVRRAMGQLLDA